MPAARPDNPKRHSETALAIRSYFGLRFVEWSKRHRVTLGGIVTLDSGQLMAAVMNLCNYMRADGKLLDARGQPRGIDGEHGLAAIMRVHRETAMRVFKGLEAEGCMRSQETRDDKGYKQPAERWMQVPKAETLSRQASTTSDLGVVRTQVGEVASLSRRTGGPKSGLRIAAPTQHPYGREKEKEETYMHGDTALPADISHGSQPQALPSVVRESNDSEEPMGPDGEPCYAWLDRDAWEKVKRQLPRDSPLRIEDDGKVQFSAIGSRLTIWFRYDWHVRRAQADGPRLRQLIRQELGPDIVVALRATSELLNLEPVA